MTSYHPDDVATVYAATFAARTDVYSQWVPDLSGWRPVREPLTTEVVLAGLTGRGPSISGFMIAPGSTSHLFALDYDRDDGLELAEGLAVFMDDNGLPAYVETSRRGAHLWCILDRALPAVAIRASVRGLLQSAGQPDDPHIEVRPGSDHVDAEWHKHVSGAVVGDGLGHALRLPFMPHPKTGKVGIMRDASGARLGPSVADVLLSVEWASADLLLPWAERWRRPPVRHIPTDKQFREKPFPEDDSSASDILRELWGATRAAPGRSIRCPAHDDKVASLSILRDDRRVICKAGSCVLNNDDHGRGTYELRKMAPMAR